MSEATCRRNFMEIWSARKCVRLPLMPHFQHGWIVASRSHRQWWRCKISLSGEFICIGNIWWKFCNSNSLYWYQSFFLHNKNSSYIVAVVVIIIKTWQSWFFFVQVCILLILSWLAQSTCNKLSHKSKEKKERKKDCNNKIQLNKILK